jgi:N utilization substance protein A
MLDLKALQGALISLEEERKIPREKIIDAIEQSLAAAYKKDYGKKGQIVRSKIDMDTGTVEFFQVKIVVDESTVKIVEEGEEVEFDENDDRSLYNSEKHILIEDAQKIRADVELDDEIIFPLEVQDDFGRVAAQTAKQVIIQRIREAERGAVLQEFGDRENEIVSGTVKKIERGLVFVDFGRATGILPRDEQIPGEHLRQGQRIRAYLYNVEDGNRGVNLRLSRTHPRFIEKLFEIEAPEIASGVVEIKAIAREAGSRSKIAVWSNDESIDPIGACVGQKGTRVTTIMNELNGEKIDIIEYSEYPEEFVAGSLSPAKVLSIEVDEDEHMANVEVAEDQLSLAIGKGGQNVRLAAKLTGWKIDIKGAEGELVADEDEVSEEEEYTNLADLKNAVAQATNDEESSEVEEAEEETEEETNE